MGKEDNPLRAKILEVACLLVAKHGYAGASVRQIVAKAKTTKPSLYYYFGNKNGLYQALIDHAYQERMRLMRHAAANHLRMEDQLVAILGALLNFARSHKDLMQICFVTAFATPGEIPREIQFRKHALQHFKFIHSVIRKGLRSGKLNRRFSSRELATSIYGQFLIHAMAEVFQPCKSKTRSIARRIVNLYLQGAQSPPRHPSA